MFQLSYTAAATTAMLTSPSDRKSAAGLAAMAMAGKALVA